MDDQIPVSAIESGMEQDYLAQIQELKRSTVSRDAYDKMRDENKKLLETIVNGGSYSGTEEKKPVRRSLEEIREDLFGDDKSNTNLRIAELSLELRDAIVAEGGIDPYFPQGRKIKATREDIGCAQNYADCIEHCVEYADGNSDVFTNELQRITDDVVIRRGYR